jgi:hypothetical protein
MKKYLLFFLVIVLSVNLFGQLIKAPADLRNLAVKAPLQMNDGASFNQSTTIPYLLHSKAYYEEEIGTTNYDLQSNTSDDNRIYLYPDGTIGATYTMGYTSSTYPDRGTGYQYFDGSAWIDPIPSVRLESVKTGWPSYSHLGTNGEIVISHAFGTGLIMLTRSTKGTGSWTQATLPAPSGIAPAWPRVCVSGNNIHILASASTAYQGQTNPIVYYRSQDAGATWDILGVMPAELTPAAGYTYGFGADSYDWAEPQGSNLAYVIGSKATDLILMKSSDNGSTWTKTVIFQHPYPNWTDTDLTPDTPYVCDGAHAVSLDANGTAHVVFGLSRFLNDDTTDASYSYFPGVDGVAYWREGDPMVASANPDDVFASGKLIGYLQDLDGSGVVLDNYTSTSIASYQCSTTSQPQISIADDGYIYVIYRSLMETMMSTGSGQFYSHIWGRMSPDGGNSWCEPVDITGNEDHDGVECVFPAMSKTTGDKLYITFQEDFEPGTNIGSDADAVTTNSIMFNSIDRGDFICTGIKESNLSGIVNIYPNPVADNATISFAFNKAANVNMTVVNLVGSTVMNDKFIAGRGEAKQINLSKLPSGIYLAKFETEKGIFTKKIIKQ